jgi:NAD(P)H-hydrate epimerase
MLRCTSTDIQQDRFAALEALKDAYGGVCVLKGGGTLMNSLDEEVYLCDLGNPGMASGGMGDVLTGIIAGLIAQGLELDEAACAGVYMHAFAADAAAGEGERGLLASDLLDQLRWIANPEYFSKI